MKKTLLLILGIITVTLLVAQEPSGYYQAAYGKKGYNLRVALFGIISSHEAQSYSSLWSHFQNTDKKNNGKVWDVYSDVPNGTPEYEFSFGDQCGNYNSEGDCYNREHSIPASWFNDEAPMYTDLFHLYPTDGYVNNRRSNHPFGEVGSASWTSTNGSKLGNCNFPGYSGTVFEPIDEYKGDFARSYFYMMTCYMNKNFGQFSNSVFNGSNLDAWALSTFLKWHEEDPVSTKEMNRNNAIYQIQGNRNPFIDHPELAGKIFSSDSVNAFNPAGISDYEEKIAHISPNPANDVITIFLPETAISTKTAISICDLSGKIVFAEFVSNSSTQINISDLKSGFYLVNILFDKQKESHKLIVF